MCFIDVFEGGILKIPLNDIYYIDVYDKYCYIHLKYKVIKTHSSLAKLWHFLETSFF